MADFLKIPPPALSEAVKNFKGVRRRQEIIGEKRGILIVDDFAHHPTAIESTLAGMRGHVGENRIWVLLEPRSNTMRMGIHKQQLAMSLAGADVICLYQPEDMDWDLNQVAADLGDRATVYTDVDAIVETLRQQLSPGDHIVVMSNGSFAGIHLKLENMLKLL